VSTPPPGGTPPPDQAVLAGADAPIELVPLAEEICRRYGAEFPDEHDRYGDSGMAWCVHDNQHILNWAVGARNGYVELEQQLAWLARVLETRDFPLDRLARNLEIAATVAADLPIADDLAAGARFIRSRDSFLED
jgi:hypothetical protein